MERLISGSNTGGVITKPTTPIDSPKKSENSSETNLKTQDLSASALAKSTDSQPAQSPTSTVTNISGADLLQEKSPVPLLILYRFGESKVPSEVQDHADKIHRLQVSLETNNKPENRREIAAKLIELSKEYVNWETPEEQGIFLLLRNAADRLKHEDNQEDYLLGAAHALDDLCKLFPESTAEIEAQIGDQLEVTDENCLLLSKTTLLRHHAQEESKKLQLLFKEVKQKTAKIEKGGTDNISEQDKSDFKFLATKLSELDALSNPVLSDLASRSEFIAKVYQEVSKLHLPGPLSHYSTEVDGTLSTNSRKWRTEARKVQQKARAAEKNLLKEAESSLKEDLKKTTLELTALGKLIHPSKGYVSDILSSVSSLWTGKGQGVAPPKQ